MPPPHCSAGAQSVCIGDGATPVVAERSAGLCESQSQAEPTLPRPEVREDGVGDGGTRRARRFGEHLVHKSPRLVPEPTGHAWRAYTWNRNKVAKTSWTWGPASRSRLPSACPDAGAEHMLRRGSARASHCGGRFLGGGKTKYANNASSSLVAWLCCTWSQWHSSKSREFLGGFVLPAMFRGSRRTREAHPSQQQQQRHPRGQPQPWQQHQHLQSPPADSQAPLAYGSFR